MEPSDKEDETSDSEMQEERPLLDFRITVETTFEHADKELAQVELWKNAAKIDRLTAYEDFMRELVQKHESKMAKERLRHERKVRQAF